MISRLNQEFSRRDSWFKVQWFEGMIARSINLHLEPGKEVYTAEDVGQQSEENNQRRHQIALLTRDDINISGQPTSSSEVVGALLSLGSAINNHPSCGEAQSNLMAGPSSKNLGAHTQWSSYERLKKNGNPESLLKIRTPNLPSI